MKKMTFLLLLAIASICSHGQNPITSVITPQTRFTSTYVERGIFCYVISKKDGNLYKRDYEEKWDGKRELKKEELILTSVREVYGGAATFFAIRNDGSLWAWGSNSFFGTVGDNTGIDKDKPVRILDNVKEVTTDIYCIGSVWAVKNDGTVYAWGNNFNAILGFGDTETRYAPEKLPIANVKYISITQSVNLLTNIIATTFSGDEYQWSGNGNNK